MDKSKFTISRRICINTRWVNYEYKDGLGTKWKSSKIHQVVGEWDFEQPLTRILEFETRRVCTWLAREVDSPSFLLSPRLCVVVNHVSRTISSPFVAFDNGSMSVNSRLRTRGPCTADLFEER